MGNVSGPLLVVIAHHSRGAQAEALAGRVGADAVLTDYGSHGARWAHQQALLWATTRRERVWVLEDDALAPHDFKERATEWGDGSRPTWCQGISGAGGHRNIRV